MKRLRVAYSHEKLLTCCWSIGRADYLFITSLYLVKIETTWQKYLYSSHGYLYMKGFVWI